VKQGLLVQLSHGLFVHPKRGRFGPVPPSDDEVMRRFLSEDQFVFTGPDRWNALGLGSTALFAAPLVYNRKRSGTFQFGGKRFMLRRVAFPAPAEPEWFVIDLFENAQAAGVQRADLIGGLRRALDEKRFDVGRLHDMAARFATRATRSALDAALALG
jgi:hypothetical protein